MPVLNVPYKSQQDNKYCPGGTCNVTSMAMCLAYFGIVGDGSEDQLEDQLYDYCEIAGLDRHNPEDLQKMINTKFAGKVKDTFTPNGTFDEIKHAIDAGNPCVVHGYFTRSGHVVVIKGYDDKGFIVNDPWGEYYPDGYDTSVTGEGVHYSYGLMGKVCSPESASDPKDIWLHILSKV